MPETNRYLAKRTATGSLSNGRHNREVFPAAILVPADKGANSYCSIDPKRDFAQTNE